MKPNASLLLPPLFGPGGSGGGGDDDWWLLLLLLLFGPAARRPERSSVSAGDTAYSGFVCMMNCHACVFSALQLKRSPNSCMGWQFPCGNIRGNAS